MRLSIDRIFPLLVALGLLASCSAKYDGQWKRDVVNEDSMAAGVEYLALNGDSTFVINNQLSFNESTENISCSFEFSYSVSGSWEMANAAIILKPDISTFDFNIDKQSFVVKFENADSTKSITTIEQDFYSEISSFMEQYYKDIYTEASADGLYMNNVYISNDSLYCVCHDSHIVWCKR